VSPTEPSHLCPLTSVLMMFGTSRATEDEAEASSIEIWPVEAAVALSVWRGRFGRPARDTSTTMTSRAKLITRDPSFGSTFDYLLRYLAAATHNTAARTGKASFFSGSGKTASHCVFVRRSNTHSKNTLLLKSEQIWSIL
jgi:hypothetical protein